MQADMTVHAQFSVGDLVRHKLFDYRGVVVDVDPCLMLSDEWYDAVARSRPPKTIPGTVCWCMTQPMKPTLPSAIWKRMPAARPSAIHRSRPVSRALRMDTTWQQGEQTELRKL